MKKKIYEAPRTVLYSVEIEGSFASSIVHSNTSEVTSTGQELKVIDATSNGWAEEGAWNDGNQWQ